MRLKVFSLYFFLLLPVVLLANFTLSGTVVDITSGKPIKNADVYNRTTHQVTMTDSRGFFEINHLPRGEHHIVVVSLEYETLEKTIFLEKDFNILISMREFQHELSEVVIRNKKEENFALNRFKPVEGTSIYAGKKSEVVLLEQLVGNIATNNARQIYSQVVGLNIYEGNDAGLQLNVGGRGLNPNRTANFNTRQNGYDISADVLGYPESYYTPPVEALSQIQVVRGAASLQYGTQFGGLINFKMKNSSEKPFELITRQSIGSFGLFTSFNSLSGTKGKFSYYTYYHHKRGKGFRDHSEFSSNNFFGRFFYIPTKKTKVTFEVTFHHYLAQQAGGLSDTQFDENPNFSNRTRNWFEVDWRLAALKLEHKFSINSNLNFTMFHLNAGRNALGFRGDPSLLNTNPITQEDIQNQDGSFFFTRDLIKGTFQNWGFEAKYLTRYKVGNQKMVFLIGSKYYQTDNTSRQGAGSNDTTPDFFFTDDRFPDYPNQSVFQFPNLNFTVFGEHIIFLNDWLSVTPGFRIEYIKTESEGTYRQVNFDNAGNPISNVEWMDNRLLERSFTLFGIGVSFEPNDHWEGYANLSQNYRSVTFSDIRVVNPSFMIDPDISDERGYTSDLGIRGKWNEKLSFDIGVFGLLYDDRIGIVLDNRANRLRKNIGRVLIHGFEMFTDLNVMSVIDVAGKQSKLNWFVNFAWNHSKYISSQENNVKGKKVEFVPTANLKTGIRFGYRKFLGNLQYTYLSSQFTDAENSAKAEEGDPKNGLIGEIPAYNVIDLSFSYTYRKWKWETGINNLWNERYFTRRATGYPGPGIIPSDPRNYYLTVQLKL